MQQAHGRGSEAPASAPIFIIGTERSGSNLLRLILNAHSEITVPHPPHIMAYFAPVEHYYGELGRDENLGRLADDIIAHVRGHIHSWPTPIDRARLLRDASPRDVFGLFAGIYDQHLVATGKRRWGCKSTFMIHYTDRILARYPHARLLWIIRDPRDVAVSSRESVFNPFHPYCTAELWAAQQRLGLHLERTLPPDNLLRLPYEQLIGAPEQTVDHICGFLGVGFEPGMLRFFDTDDARTSAALARDWRNTAAPIMAGNARKFLHQLSAKEIALVESVASPTMRELGYERVEPATIGNVGRLQRAWYRLLNALIRGRVEYRSLREDRNGWRRWGRELRIMLLTSRLKLGWR